MASLDRNKPADRESVASGDAPGSFDSGGCAEGLGLLVWLGQLARDESARRPSQLGIAESLDPRRSIGRFQLEVLLGAGAYGAVFRALDTQLGRRVALKLAWPGVLMDPVASRRFIEEPKTVASLKHRGIVEVYDSGEIEMAAFIALELIDGPTLAQWIKRQEHVSPRLAAQILRSVAGAVQFAHEHNVVHRDLKPSNILLRPTVNGDGFGFEPVVTDFGLARRPRLSEMSNLTGTQAIIGTDHYMSPEQAAGRKDDVGPASDIFSLGVILYELVAGCRPFDGDSSEQVRQRIQLDEPAPIRPWRKSVPKDLETIALKCLEKSPGRRYESAQELADDLGRFLDGKPIVARPVGLVQRSLKFVRRKPLVVSLVALAVVSLLAIAGLAGAWIDDRMDSARRIDAAEAAATVSEGVEREHRYIANIRHAAEALRRGSRRNVLDLLDECRKLEGEPVRRGIEWDYLSAQVNDFDRTIRVSRDSVHSVRFSPRGDLLVSAGEDGRVVLWDTKTWTKRAELNDNVGEVRIAEPSPDGSLLAVAGDDGRVVVHRLADGEVIFDETIVKGRVFDAVWLGNDRQLAIGGEDAVLTILDPNTGRRRGTPPLDPSPPRELTDPGHPVEIAGLAYVPTRDAIAVVMKPSGLRVFDAATLSPTSFRVPQSADYNPVCFVPLGPGYLATRTGEHRLGIRSLEVGTVTEIMEMNCMLRALRYSSAAGVMAAAFREGTVETWDAEALVADSAPRARRFCAHDGRAVSADISPDGHHLASGGEDGVIRLWHERSLRDPFDVPLADRPWQAAFSPCGRWLAVVTGPAGLPGRVTMLDARTGKRLWSSADDAPVSSGGDSFLSQLPAEVAFDPSGSEVVMLQSDFSVQGRDARTGRVMNTYRAAMDEPVNRTQVSPDGQSVVVRSTGIVSVLGRNSRTTARYSVPPTQECLGIFRTSRGDVWVKQDSPEARVLLFSDLRGKPVIALDGPSEKVQAAAVSSDGRYLAIGALDRIIYIWDLSTGDPPTKCIGHDNGFGLLMFAPDGGTLISHSNDYSVRFWHVETGAELLKIGSREEPVLCMGLNPAGNLLVLGVEHNGRYGLQIHRLGPNRDSLPRAFEFAPPDAP